jgi:hypothetical protein
MKGKEMVGMFLLSIADTELQFRLHHAMTGGYHKSGSLHDALHSINMFLLN